MYETNIRIKPIIYALPHNVFVFGHTPSYQLLTLRMYPSATAFCIKQTVTMEDTDLNLVNSDC